MQIRYGKDITSPWCLTSLGFCPRFYIVVLEMTFLSGHIFHTLFGLLLSFCFPFLFALYSHFFFSKFICSTFAQLSLFSLVSQAVDMDTSADKIARLAMLRKHLYDNTRVLDDLLAILAHECHHCGRCPN